MYQKIRSFIIVYFFFALVPSLLAADAELVMMTKLELPDVELIGRTVDCQSWKLNGEFYFDSPDKFDFFVNSSYRLLLEFSANSSSGTIDHTNFEKAGYSVEIASSNPDHFLPSGLFVENKEAYFLLQSGNIPESLGTLSINLISNSTKKTLSTAQIEMQLKPQPSAENPYTTWLPYKYSTFPARLKFVDQTNPQNIVTTDVTFPGHIVLDKSKQYNVFVELRKIVVINGKEYETSLNYKNDLGYKVNLSWGNQSAHPTLQVIGRNGFRNKLNLTKLETKPRSPNTYIIPKTNLQISSKLYSQSSIPKLYSNLNWSTLYKKSKKRGKAKLKKNKKINKAFLLKQNKRLSSVQLRNQAFLTQNYKLYTPYAKKLSPQWNSNLKLVNPPKTKQNLMLAQPLIQMQLMQPAPPNKNLGRNKKSKNPEQFTLVMSINNPFSDMENIKEIKLIVVDPKK